MPIAFLICSVILKTRANRITGVPTPLIRFLLAQSVNISLNESDLQPLVEAVVALTLNKLEDERRQIGDKLAYSEPEAAALLSVKPHVLRDARLRGEIEGFKLGKGMRYARDELLRFLRKHQTFDR